MKNSPNQQQWIEWIKKFPDWVKATIGLVTIIIGFVIAFRTDYYLSILVVGTLILVSLLFLFIYLAFTKTPPLVEGGKGVHRYEKYRPIAFVGILIIILIICSLIALRPSRSFVITALAGTATSQPTPTTIPTPTTTPTSTPTTTPTPTPTTTPTIEPVLTIPQTLLSKSNTDYRLEATIDNPFEQDVLIKEIVLYSSERENVACTDTPPQTYEFSDVFTISSIEGDKLVFQGSIANSNDKEFQYRVEGESYNTCGIRNLTLQFDTSFVLPAKSFSQFYLLFPHEMGLTDGENNKKISFVSDYYCKHGYGEVSVELHILTDRYGEIITDIPADIFCKTK